MKAKVPTCVVVLAGAMLTTSAAPGGPGIVITTLVMEGDVVAGVGLVTTINNIAVNDAGSWLVEADTNNPDTDADSVLLRDGVLDWREGDVVAAPPGATLDSFDSITLNDSGQSGYNFFLDNTAGIFDDSGVYGFLSPLSGPFAGTVLVVQESEAAPGLSPGTPFIGFFDVKINNAADLMVVASIDDPNIPTSVDRALYIIESDDTLGGITGFDVVVVEAEVIPGQAEAVQEIGTGPHQSAFTDSGHVMFFVDLEGSTTRDGAIYHYDGLDRLLLAQEANPSPVAGRKWLSLSSPELDMSNTGHHVYSGRLDGDTASDTLIVVNGAKYRQEGDPVPGASPGGFALTSFGSGPLEINDFGEVLWYGDWDDPDTDVDTGLFLGDTMLVQEGVTVIEGSVVDTIRGVEDGYHMSNNGKNIIFEAVLLDGREGAFLITFPDAPCPWDCDGPDGMVGINDLLALLAQWGGPGACDSDGSGTVGITDFLDLLANWGAC